MQHSIKKTIYEALKLDSPIARNSLLLLIAELFRTATTFITSVMLGRYLQPEGLGVWRFVVNYCIVIAVLTDAGISRVTVRRIARAPWERHSKYLGTLIKARVILSTFAIAVLLASLTVLPAERASSETKVLLIIYMFSQIFQAFRKNSEVVWQARQQLGYHAVFAVLNRMVMLLVVSAAIVFRASLGAIVLAYVCIDLLDFAVANWFLNHKFVRPEIPRGFKRVLLLIREAFPFGLQFYAQHFRYYLDVVLMKFIFAGQGAAIDKEIGLYGAATPFVVSLHFFPSSLAGAVYPELARAYLKARMRFSRLTATTIIVLFGMGSSLTMLLYFARHIIINLTFGQRYQASIDTLGILVWMLPFFFLNGGLLVIFAACNRQNILSATNWLGTILKIVLCLLLIPSGGAQGAATASVTAEGATALILLGELSRSHPQAVPWKTMLLIATIQLAYFGLVLQFLQQKLLFAFLLAAQGIFGTVGTYLFYRRARKNKADDAV